MVITDYPSIESLVARADMIEESFTAVYPDAEFLPRILGGTAENGVTSMETALQANPDIIGVLGINDAGNLGAYQALENAGRGPDDVFIFGIDCDPQAVELIDSGTMYKGCVDTNPVGTGVLAADAFALWLAGGTVPGIIEVPVQRVHRRSAAPARRRRRRARDDRMTELAVTDAPRDSRPWTAAAVEVARPRGLHRHLRGVGGVPRRRHRHVPHPRQRPAAVPPGGDLLDRRHRGDDGDAPRRARHLVRRDDRARRLRVGGLGHRRHAARTSGSPSPSASAA